MKQNLLPLSSLRPPYLETNLKKKYSKGKSYISSSTDTQKWLVRSNPVDGLNF